LKSHNLILEFEHIVSKSEMVLSASISNWTKNHFTDNSWSFTSILHEQTRFKLFSNYSYYTANKVI